VSTGEQADVIRTGLRAAETFIEESRPWPYGIPHAMAEVRAAFAALASLVARCGEQAVLLEGLQRELRGKKNAAFHAEVAETQVASLEAERDALAKVLRAYAEFDDVIAALSDARREKYRALQAALGGRLAQAERQEADTTSGVGEHPRGESHAASRQPDSLNGPGGTPNPTPEPVPSDDHAALELAFRWIACLPEGRSSSQATCAFVPQDVYDRIAAAMATPCFVFCGADTCHDHGCRHVYRSAVADTSSGTSTE
jgi:hypothetical protein